MLLRQQPLNLEEYYIIDNQKSQELQEKGFIPMFYWEENFYFYKSQELINFIEGR